MKKIALVLGMAGVMALVSACSDEKSEIAEYKTNFVNTCTKASGDSDAETTKAVSAICGCAYDKTIEKYGLAEFKRLDGELQKSASAAPEFQQTMIGFVQECATSAR
ncbi:Uncharacterised protein [Providencia rustigianii]|uniref:Lipoprotein n=2 Tax=Providencia rustigianii TaxID=158850 RepID=D1NZF4_9GAMM|nr:MULTISPECIES: hypothetical protein [Providencia]EFB73220.1 hypothetical protein PROVRUST_05308 [Providencia rustigianii DSM 4541]MTC57132.1 hypothetical protein [Providencia rustigianii]MTC60437.1 hypothetical protein [Providencia rustigianii]SPY77246.1 Uncharacterised protein [Providencia rustigianii]SUC35197.1 Uncharacterised protein [Providencia rustigianii]